MKNGQKVVGPDDRPVLVERGRLLVSLEIVPLAEAQVRPVSNGTMKPVALIRLACDIHRSVTCDLNRFLCLGRG